MPEIIKKTYYLPNQWEVKSQNIYTRNVIYNNENLGITGLKVAIGHESGEAQMINRQGQLLAVMPIDRTITLWIPKKIYERIQSGIYKVKISANMMFILDDKEMIIELDEIHP